MENSNKDLKKKNQSQKHHHGHHILLMILCFLIPLALIFKLPSIIPNSSEWSFLLILIFPLAHALMMIPIMKSNKENKNKDDDNEHHHH